MATRSLVRKTHVATATSDQTRGKITSQTSEELDSTIASVPAVSNIQCFSERRLEHNPQIAARFAVSAAEPRP
jgi:hypothetical protein